MVYWINLGACVSLQEGTNLKNSLRCPGFPRALCPGNLLPASSGPAAGVPCSLSPPPHGPSVPAGLCSALFLMVSCIPALRDDLGFSWHIVRNQGLCYAFHPIPSLSLPLKSSRHIRDQWHAPTHASGGGRKVFSLLSWVSLNLGQVLCPVSLVSGMGPLSNHPLPRSRASLIF